MSHFKAARMAACLAVLVAVLVGGVSGASASDASIKQAIKSYNGKVLEAEGHVVTALGEYKTTRNPANVQSAITSSITVLKALRAKIASQSANSERVKAGKAKFEKGLHQVIVAYEGLKTAFAEKAASPTAAKEQAEKAIKTVAKARKELAEGVKLLR